MPNQQRLTALVIAVFGYVVKFIAYNFLTPAVLMTFAALMVIYITLMGPELPFLQYFSFLLPVDGRGNASIDEDDILKAYGFLTMALFGLSVAGGWFLRVLKQMFRADADDDRAPASQSLLAIGKRRLLIGSIVITLIYLIVFAVIPFVRMAEGASSSAMYPVFVIFYIVALIANAIYIGIDSLSDMMLGWAWSRVLSG